MISIWISFIIFTTIDLECCSSSHRISIPTVWLYPNLVDTSKSPMYKGKRRCSNL